MHLSNFIQHISFKLTTPYGMECAFKVRHVLAKKYFSNDTIMLNYFILLCTLKQYRFSLAINNLYWLEWKNLRHFQVDKVKNVDHLSLKVVHLTIIILKLYNNKNEADKQFHHHHYYPSCTTPYLMLQHSSYCRVFHTASEGEETTRFIDVIMRQKAM